MIMVYYDYLQTVHCKKILVVLQCSTNIIVLHCNQNWINILWFNMMPCNVDHSLLSIQSDMLIFILLHSLERTTLVSTGLHEADVVPPNTVVQ